MVQLCGRRVQRHAQFVIAIYLAHWWGANLHLKRGSALLSLLHGLLKHLKLNLCACSQLRCFLSPCAHVLQSLLCALCPGATTCTPLSAGTADFWGVFCP